jgi:hypothetical protein
MGSYGKFLNIVPCHCRYCSGASICLERLTQEAQVRGLIVTELLCSNAEHDPVWAALTNDNPIFVHGYGHGNRGIYTGDSETMIFDTTHCDILSQRVIYLLSCLTANELGPAAIAAGAIAYVGFNIEWTWGAVDLDVDPYLDWYAEAYYRSSNEFPIAMFEGNTVQQAAQRSIDEYNRWINIWETERGNDQYAAEEIKWLIWDRDGLVVLGDPSAQIRTPGLVTSIITDIKPPANSTSGEVFPFTGRLLDTIGAPLTGETINLLIDGVVADTTTTLADGSWTFNVALTSGIKYIVAQFPGDATYGESTTTAYRVEVGLTTMATLLLPPLVVNPEGAFIFSGTLVDKRTGVGIPSRGVDLYVNDVLTASLTTGDGGRWTFGVPVGGLGDYYVYAKFNGDPIYFENVTETYRVRAGLPPIIGNDAPPSYGVYIEPYLFGTVVTPTSDAVAINLTAALYHASSTQRAKCLIYDYSDWSLVAMTEELVGLTERGWHTFNFIGTKPLLKAGKKYYLVVWSDAGADPSQYWTEGVVKGPGWLDNPGFYNGYYSPWWPGGPTYWMPSIYCTFQIPPMYSLAISESMGGSTDVRPDTYTVQEGTTVILSAYPSSGYRFDHWLLDGVTHIENPISVLMNANHSLQAVFTTVTPPQFNLTITSTAGGTTDPAPGTYSYTSGDTAIVSANPSSGYNFISWLLDGVTHIENPISVLMNTNHNLGAIFSPTPPPGTRILTIDATTGGTTDPAPGTYAYTEGTIAQIVAYPRTGYIFNHWLLDGVSRQVDNPISVLMESNHTLTAVFITGPPVPKPLGLYVAIGAATVAGIAYLSQKKVKFK